MITSDSNIDFISLARASGIDPDTIVNTPEFAEWMREYLSESKVAVTFTKKDGSERRMVCTKKSDLIPTDKLPKGTGSQSTGDAVAAFDLEKQEWRSFNTGSIKHIEWNVA
jgi:WYL_2, Sm-like SH3 beta-barrel fold